QESTVATVNADYQQAKLEAEAKQSLADEKLIGSLELKQALIRADTLKTRLDIEQRRLDSADESIDARTRVQEAAVDTAREVMRPQESRLSSQKVRPGLAGVLQQVPVEVGQRVPPGPARPRLAHPMDLKAAPPI